MEELVWTIISNQHGRCMVGRWATYSIQSDNIQMKLLAKPIGTHEVMQPSIYRSTGTIEWRTGHNAMLARYARAKSGEHINKTSHRLSSNRVWIWIMCFCLDLHSSVCCNRWWYEPKQKLSCLYSFIFSNAGHKCVCTLRTSTFFLSSPHRQLVRQGPMQFNISFTSSQNAHMWC